MIGFAVRAVGFDAAAPETSMVGDALALFARWSRGAFRPDLALLPPLLLPGPASRFAALGGMTRLGGPSLAALAVPPGAGRTLRLLLVAKGPFHPHCWRLPAEQGGSYALLPAGASAGIAAHELGHLLLGWSDAPWAGRHCLMGSGARGTPPAAPRASLRLQAGWDTQLTADAATTAGQLGVVRHGPILMERRDTMLLVWPHEAAPTEIELSEDDLDRPLLALLALLAPAPVGSRSRVEGSLR